jgi:hypothetical protein
MNLVTVTYFADLRNMLVQAESINRFALGVTHWVVICSTSNNMARWRRLLEPYYQGSNRLKLIRAPSELMTAKSGYMNQQLLKLWIAGSIQDDYLILDSKNFFIQPTDSSVYENYIATNGWGYDISDETFPGTIYKTCAIESSRYLGNTTTRFVIPGIGTPYKISWKNMQKLIEKFQSIDLAMLWVKSVIEKGKRFQPGRADVFSEFVFYAQLMDDDEVDILKNTVLERIDTNRTVWDQGTFINYLAHNRLSLKKKRPVTALLECFTKKQVHTVAFHRRWFYDYPEYLPDINKWLSEQGINTKLKIGRSYNAPWV